MGETQSTRRPRSDARRNRDRLLEVASRALADGDGAISLEAVAREAGVGIGTLYRNFPNRESLIEAVYAAEVDNLTADASGLLDRMGPRDALREWLVGFASFARTKHGLADALRSGVVHGGGDAAYSRTREQMAAAIAPILEAGAKDSSLRADVDPGDLVILVAGALMGVRTDSAQTERLLGLIIDALRPV